MNKLWIKAAGIRAIKTFAQAMVAQMGAGSIGITQFDWGTALSISSMAAIMSLFTSLAGLPEVDRIEKIQNTFNEDGTEMLAEVQEYENTEDTTKE